MKTKNKLILPSVLLGLFFLSATSVSASIFGVDSEVYVRSVVLHDIDENSPPFIDPWEQDRSEYTFHHDILGDSPNDYYGTWLFWGPTEKFASGKEREMAAGATTIFQYGSIFEPPTSTYNSENLHIRKLSYVNYFSSNDSLQEVDFATHMKDIYDGDFKKNDNQIITLVSKKTPGSITLDSDVIKLQGEILGNPLGSRTEHDTEFTIISCAAEDWRNLPWQRGCIAPAYEEISLQKPSYEIFEDNILVSEGFLTSTEHETWDNTQLSFSTSQSKNYDVALKIPAYLFPLYNLTTVTASFSTSQADSTPPLLKNLNIKQRFYPGTHHPFTIEAEDDTAISNIEVTYRFTSVSRPPEVIVDDADSPNVIITGDWSQTSNPTSFYMYGLLHGPTYLHDKNSGKGSKSVTFIPDLPQTGKYQVFVRYLNGHVDGTGRGKPHADNVPLEIAHTNGVQNLILNQNAIFQGGIWHYLGEYDFNSGSSQSQGSVTIRNGGTSEYVTADAVKFVLSQSNVEIKSEWLPVIWNEPLQGSSRSGNISAQGEIIDINISLTDSSNNKQIYTIEPIALSSREIDMEALGKSALDLETSTNIDVDPITLRLFGELTDPLAPRYHNALHALLLNPAEDHVSRGLGNMLSNLYIEGEKVESDSQNAAQRISVQPDNVWIYDIIPDYPYLLGLEWQYYRGGSISAIDYGFIQTKNSKGGDNVSVVVGGVGRYPLKEFVYRGVAKLTSIDTFPTSLIKKGNIFLDAESKANLIIRNRGLDDTLPGTLSLYYVQTDLSGNELAQRTLALSESIEEIKAADRITKNLTFTLNSADFTEIGQYPFVKLIAETNFPGDTNPNDNSIEVLESISFVTDAEISFVFRITLNPYTIVGFLAGPIKVGGEKDIILTVINNGLSTLTNIPYSVETEKTGLFSDGSPPQVFHSDTIPSLSEGEVFSIGDSYGELPVAPIEKGSHIIRATVSAQGDQAPGNDIFEETVFFFSAGHDTRAHISAPATLQAGVQNTIQTSLFNDGYKNITVDSTIKYQYGSCDSAATCTSLSTIATNNNNLLTPFQNYQTGRAPTEKQINFTFTPTQEGPITFVLEADISPDTDDTPEDNTFYFQATVGQLICEDQDLDGYDNCSPGQQGDDGLTLDCDDSPLTCGASCSPGILTETSCTDTYDNNCNSQTDCDDPDCSADPACQVDTTPPSISFTSPTPADQSSQASTTIPVHLSSSDAASSHYTFLDFDSSLKLWMTFDDIDGSTGNALDISGNDNFAIFNGDAQVTSNGIFGSGVALDGNNDYVERNKKIATSYPFTVSAWARSPTPSGVIFSLSDKDVTNKVLGLRFANGEIQIFARNTDFKTSGAPASPNTWYHVTGVFNSATDKRLYVDGVRVADLTDSVSFPSAIDRFSIGRNGDSTPGGYLTGTVDDVLLFQRALSDSEILSLYNSQATQYQNDFASLSLSQHTFQAHAVDGSGNRAQTELRTVTIEEGFPPPIDVPENVIDTDNVINILDLSKVGSKFGSSDCSLANNHCERADVDRSGSVNILDLSRVGARFGDIV